MATLPEIVADYRKLHRARARMELDEFAREPSLSAAVDRAARAERRDGRRFSHQCRITREAIAQSRRALSSALADLRRCESFQELHDLVRTIVGKIQGIGEL